MSYRLLIERIKLLEQQKKQIRDTVEKAIQAMIDKYLAQSNFDLNDPNIKEKIDEITRDFKAANAPILEGDKIVNIDREIESLKRQL